MTTDFQWHTINKLYGKYGLHLEHYKIYHIIILVSNAGAISITFTALLLEIAITLYTIYSRLIGLLLNTNDSTITSQSRLQSAIYLNRNCPFTAAIFNSSVVENSPTRGPAWRTAALIFLVSVSRLYLRRPIRGLESREGRGSLGFYWHYSLLALLFINTPFGSFSLLENCFLLLLLNVHISKVTI